VRRSPLITVGVIVVLGVIVFVWWLPAHREAQLQDRLAAIEAMEDLTVKKEAALNFLLENRMADRELLLRALDAAAAQFAGSNDSQGLVDVYQKLYDQDLSPWLRYRVIARLDRALIQVNTDDSVARAEDLARQMLDVKDAPLETFSSIVYFHNQNERTDPKLTLEVALAGESAVDRDSVGSWPWMLDTAFTGFMRRASEEQGLAAALDAVEAFRDQATNPSEVAALNAAIYMAAVRENEDAAIRAAIAIADISGLTDSGIPNRIAYDMAERGLAPDVAVRLGLTALSLASSRYDSMNVLDTAGWAYYALGNFPQAAQYLSQAVGLMDETLTSDNEIVQHLIAAYDEAGMTDDSIDLLARVAGRSVDADDPAREQLRSKLIQRDGNAKALDGMIAAARYDGTEEAPGFSLPDRNGGTVALDDLKGDIVIACFWSYG
jgi:tetratricopeptide (TPR) repeat protein